MEIKPNWQAKLKKLFALDSVTSGPCSYDSTRSSPDLT